MSNQNTMSTTQKLVMYAVLTAVVVILQMLGSSIRLGVFSISLVLIPIVIGAAICGPKAGAWLGFVFGVVVLISGDAAPFLAVNVPGTIVTVLVKGITAGLITGLVYNSLKSVNSILAIVVAAIVCPVVNTGIFLLGCYAFFMEIIELWASESPSVASFIIFGLVGGNFLFEVAANAVLSPVIVRILKIRKNM